MCKAERSERVSLVENGSSDLWFLAVRCVEAQVLKIFGPAGCIQAFENVPMDISVQTLRLSPGVPFVFVRHHVLLVRSSGANAQFFIRTPSSSVSSWLQPQAAIGRLKNADLFRSC